jgi:hypothetical protein
MDKADISKLMWNLSNSCNSVEDSKKYLTLAYWMQMDTLDIDYLHYEEFVVKKIDKFQHGERVIQMSRYITALQEILIQIRMEVQKVVQR